MQPPIPTVIRRMRTYTLLAQCVRGVTQTIWGADFKNICTPSVTPPLKRTKNAYRQFLSAS